MCEVLLHLQPLTLFLRCEVQRALKSKSIDSNKRGSLQSLEEKLQQKIEELSLAATDVKMLSRQREKRVLAKCFHKIGIVVPYDKKTDVGYRSLPKTNSK